MLFYIRIRILINNIYQSFIPKMRLLLLPVLILCLLLPLASPQTFCQNCLNNTCGFTCYSQACQAYTTNQTCQCIPSYYFGYSTQTNNFTSCVSCNYTFAGCVLCNAATCTQCLPDYVLFAGRCYTQGGYPVGYVEPYEQICITFVVFFAIFGAFFAVMSVLKYCKMSQSSLNASLMSKWNDRIYVLWSF